MRKTWQLEGKFVILQPKSRIYGYIINTHFINNKK